MEKGEEKGLVMGKEIFFMGKHLDGGNYLKQPYRYHNLSLYCEGIELETEEGRRYYLKLIKNITMRDKEGIELDKKMMKYVSEHKEKKIKWFADGNYSEERVWKGINFKKDEIDTYERMKSNIEYIIKEGI